MKLENKIAVIALGVVFLAGAKIGYNQAVKSGNIGSVESYI